MKKKLSIALAVFATMLIVVGIVSQQTGASRNIFNTGTDDERELAKQTSFGILRDRAAQRAIGNPYGYTVKPRMCNSSSSASPSGKVKPSFTWNRTASFR